MKFKLRLMIVVGALLSLGFFGMAAAQDDQPAKGAVGGLVSGAGGAVSGAPRVTLDVSSTAPRQVEDTTERAIVRDYGRAWHDMADALAQNRADLLPASFVGIAQQKLADRIAAQQKSGLETRIVDHGHNVQAIFYSPEGSAMELHDTAQLEIQVLDGSSVVNTQTVTARYTALMTVAEDRWKVRVLQETQ
ncbi:MAG TPA: hypothetical protein VE998_12630 [Terriglobales bacterium]|nr:hypothetical protein [Terriglobales bacterium]